MKTFLAFEISEVVFIMLSKCKKANKCWHFTSYKLS